jgi:hypothetical protein
VIETILEFHPKIIRIFNTNVIGNENISNFGRKDTPRVEEILRIAFYKRIKGL